MDPIDIIIFIALSLFFGTVLFLMNCYNTYLKQFVIDWNDWAENTGWFIGLSLLGALISALIMITYPYSMYVMVVVVSIPIFFFFAPRVIEYLHDKREEAKKQAIQERIDSHLTEYTFMKEKNR